MVHYVMAEWIEQPENAEQENIPREGEPQANAKLVGVQLVGDVEVVL